MHQHRQTQSLFDQALREAQWQVSQMPRDILQNLNNTPSVLSHFIQTLPTIQSLKKTREHFIKHNRQLAMNNLKKEPELIAARTELSRCFTELAPLRDNYLKIRSEEMKSPDLILGQLQSIVHESERLNDEMIETFPHTKTSEHDINIFIKNFLHDRRETIKLRFLTEKFFDLYEIEKRKK
jgi:hypothetical protein